MEEKILEVIYHVKSVSNKKPSYKNILSHIQKSTACNIDLEVIEKTVWDMFAKKIIEKDFRILSESCNSFTLPQTQITLKLFIWKKEAKVFKNQLTNQ